MKKYMKLKYRKSQSVANLSEKLKSISFRFVLHSLDTEVQKLKHFLSSDE